MEFSCFHVQANDCAQETQRGVEQGWLTCDRRVSQGWGWKSQCQGDAGIRQREGDDARKVPATVLSATTLKPCNSPEAGTPILWKKKPGLGWVKELVKDSRFQPWSVRWQSLCTSAVEALNSEEGKE